MLRWHPVAIWYVCYGSNLSRSRFDRYLTGGRPAHARAADPGARDVTPPAGDLATTLPGTVWFASWSRSWGGAVAFYDDDARVAQQPTLGRAYLLSDEQLLDVAAQEHGLAPGAVDGPVPPVGSGERAALHDGRYGTLIGCPPIDGMPAATLTAPWPLGHEPVAAPSLDYLRTISDGLAEAHGLAVEDRASYLARLPGVGPTFTAAALAALL